MTTSTNVLLINPKITSRRSARFPLSLLALAGSLKGQYQCQIIDGNIDQDYLAKIRQVLTERSCVAVGVTVMGGPQVESAINVSKTIRLAAPTLPIIWGGYFPTLYTNAAMNAPYVDYAIRGQGEGIFTELLDTITRQDYSKLETISGLTWKRNDDIVHNGDRAFGDRRAAVPLPYELLGDPRKYLVKTFLGARTSAYQAALGCRFRCTFCGVAAMFRGAIGLPPAARLERDLVYLRDQIGSDSIQYFDHNFFDREADMVPILEVLAKMQMPWWCYARADALLNLSDSSWALVRKSKLKMAYIGAESPNDALLKSIRKGTRSDQTLAVAELCRRHGVIPELSFMVAPPNDPEGETERTFDFIREVKRVNPHSEIIIYIYTPISLNSLTTKARAHASAAPAALLDLNGNPIRFPQTPEEWSEQRWVDYACHGDAPWVSEQLRRRIHNFVTVLGCRFPTVQDIRSPSWAKAMLSVLAAWRYGLQKYDRPWELDLSKNIIKLSDPRVTSI